ncbi:MAG: vanadium-dependent haloperoxidase [Microvirga sp.]
MSASRASSRHQQIGRSRIAVTVAASFALWAVPNGAEADAVTDWNVHAMTATATMAGPFHARALGYVHAAIFDAVNAVERRYTSQFVDLQAPAGASPEAAAAASAHGVLTRLFPNQKATLDAALASSLAAVPDGQGEQDGVALGQTVAERIFAMSVDDGSTATKTYTPGATPTSWSPTLSGIPARFAQWGGVRLMMLKSRDQFKLPGFPPIDSARYAEEVNEVAALGSATSQARTGEQTAVAIFWTISASVPLNAAARAASVTHHFDLAQNARLFALVNMATHDACIAIWGAKYDYDMLRPETAIRDAPKLGNPGIHHIPDWEPLLVTPAFPDYPSGHSGVTGAGVGVLQRVFGSDEVEVSVNFPTPPAGVTRRYKSFSAIESEVIEARIWAGAHIRTSDVDAAQLGHQIADYAVANFMRPRTPF